METRNTIQRNTVLKAVRTMKSHVTADDVYSFIHDEYPSISKGTVYRNLNTLSELGEIKKVEIPDGPDRFDFTLDEHYHVVCVKCGKVYDVDMSVFPDMLGKIADPHGIEYLSYDILFKGICPDCQNNK